MQQIDLIRDCCNKHPIPDIMNHRVDVKTLTWLACQTHYMIELIDYQAARISKLEADQGALVDDLCTGDRDKLIVVDRLVKLYTTLDITTNPLERERIIEQIRKIKGESVFGKCSSCMCTSSDVAHCNDVHHARRWLLDSDEVCGKFEDAADTYTSLHPGKFRPFMMAWCDLLGGI